MPDKKFDIQHVVDSLATISDIIFKRLECVECNQCEPCGVIFMGALKVLRDSGHVGKQGGPVAGGGQIAQH